MEKTPPRLLEHPQEIMDFLRRCHDEKPPRYWLFCVHPGRVPDFNRLMIALAALNVPPWGQVGGNCLIEVVGLVPERFIFNAIPRESLPADLLTAVLRQLAKVEHPGHSVALVIAHPGEAEAFMTAVLDASLNPETVKIMDRPDPLTN